MMTDIEKTVRVQRAEIERLCAALAAAESSAAERPALVAAERRNARLSRRVQDLEHLLAQAGGKTIEQILEDRTTGSFLPRWQ